MTFFCRSFHAGETSDWRAAYVSAPHVSSRCPFRSSLISAMPASRSARSGTIAVSRRSLNDSAAVHVSSPYRGLGSNGFGFTSAWATSSSCASISSSIARLAASRPSATTGSVGAVPRPPSSKVHVLSGASPSIIKMSTCPASLRRPATTMSNVASSRSWNVGLMTHSPSIKPSRTEPTGPSNGIPDSIVARLAAFIPGMSYGLAMSTESTVITTWTSSR